MALTSLLTKCNSFTSTLLSNQPHLASAKILVSARGVIYRWNVPHSDLYGKHHKRRKSYPFWWWPQRQTKVRRKTQALTKENESFIDSLIKYKYELKEGESPLKQSPFQIGEYTPGSQRCGLIGKKLGVHIMWLKTGKRIYTTAIHIPENHVIKYHTPEEYQQICRPYHSFEYFKKFGMMVIGAQNMDPRLFTSAYTGLFSEAGVMPKARLSHFSVTPNAALPPGTPLSVMHFRVGDHVEVRGKTIKRGFLGPMALGYRGLGRRKNITKSHRRMGCFTSRGRKSSGPWRGAVFPGFWGNEWRLATSLRIRRINTKYNVIWLDGQNIPGDVHDFVYLYDTRAKNKKKGLKPDNYPPFPTYFPNEETADLPEDIWDSLVQPHDDPTIIFEETEEERKAAAAALHKKAKTAKLRMNTAQVKRS